jgi:hypothetical protein
MSDTTAPTPTTTGDTKPTPKKRSWRWRLLRFLVLSFAGLVTLFVLFHAEENWRGKRAWEQYRKEQEAKGVSFDFNSIVPPPIPDEKNFAMTPLLKPLLELKPPGSETRFKDPDGYAKTDIQLLPQPWSESQRAVWDSPPWRLGRRISLLDWQTAIFESTNLLHHAEKGTPAEDVLYAITQHKSQMTELLLAARERPLCRFDVKYDEENKAGILLPHLAKLKGMAYAFQLRAVASLDVGKVDEAFDDVNMIFFLSDSVKTEGLLISHLVRMACYNIAHQTIWEGLINHRWKPEHLAFWQQKIAAYDFVKDGYRGMQGERAFGNSIIDYLRKYPHMLDTVGDDGMMNLPASSGFERHLYKLIPTGWFYMEQLTYNRLYDDFILGACAKDKELLDVKQVKDTRERMVKFFSRRGPFTAFVEHKVLVYILMPSLGSFIQNSVYAQSTTDLVVMAIALEQYHQHNQDYPSNLSGLGAEHLPMDILTMKRFQYERQSKDSFRLWSVGWDLKDDNGTVGLKGSSSVDLDKGDWTWPQAESVKE